MAFGLVPRYAPGGIVPALATQKAAIAIVAVLGILDQAEHGPARHDAQQCPQRADCPAPEPGDAEIERNNKDEDYAQPNPLPEVGLFEAEEQCSQKEVQRTA